MKKGKSDFVKSIGNGLKLLMNGKHKVFWNQLSTRVYSKSISYGLKRDLKIPFKSPDAKVELIIRAFKESDRDLLLHDSEKLDSIEEYTQQNLIEANIDQCYVATTAEGSPCYMQWLVSNPNGSKPYYFQGIFPELNTDEALLEGAFVPPSFRGMWVMPAAMARIACMGSTVGARWVITFVHTDNIPSLKGCKRAGFSPYILRTDRWLLFRRRVFYSEIPNQLMNQYQKVTT